MKKIKLSDSKICFISLDNINRIPYIDRYRQVLNCSYDIIYWNRNNTKENCGAQNYFSYYFDIKNAKIKKIAKLFGYIGFARYVKKILKKNKYSGVIAMTGNCCVLNYSILRKLYKGRYIIEIRDYWKEHNKTYYKLEKKAIEDSYAAIVSSPAYKTFLPEYNYIQAHNVNLLPDDALERIRRRVNNQCPIVISCIGGAKNLEYDKKVLLKFKNDHRFLVRYIGRGYEALLPFCESNSINNVYIEGLFPQEKTLDYYENTDMILNLYGNNRPSVDYALSNKLYFAAQIEKPILVCPNTYMADISTENGFGFVFDINDDNATDKLYDYYQNLDRDKLHDDCNNFLNYVSKDMAAYEEIIKKFETNMINGDRSK